MTVTEGTMLRDAWEEAVPFTEFLDTVDANRLLWEGMYRTAKVPAWALEQACARGPGIRLLVLAEDWCGDAANSVPLLARLGEEARCLDMRVVRRDEHPALMDRYLTNGSRSIPIVIVLDRDATELGRWGPRPEALQRWVLEHKESMPADERYRHVRRWYAQDRGVTILREVLSVW